MKKAFIQVLVMIFSVTIFFSCAPSAKDILKIYDAYGETDPTTNKAGIQIETHDIIGVCFSYSDFTIKNNQEYVNKLAKRWFVVDAENPEIRLPIEMGVINLNQSTNAVEAPTSFLHNLALRGDEPINSRFLLVGFEGISASELKEAETQPLFFLVENGKEGMTIITKTPRLAKDLFAPDYKPIFFKDQVYSSQIKFEESKNVNLELIVSPDLTQIKKLTLSIEELPLTPKNYDKVRKTTKKKTLFEFLENTELETSFATTSSGGYNVLFRTPGASYLINGLKLINGGIEATEPVEASDGKIIMDERPLILDLTVIDECIYGTVKVELNECGTPATYTVLKNTTTPQDIPESILKN